MRMAFDPKFSEFEWQREKDNIHSNYSVSSQSKIMLLFVYVRNMFQSHLKKYGI